MNLPPSGLLTFLFTDIEGSTAAWEAAPTTMPSVLARHDSLLRESFDDHSGFVFATGGDGFAVAFSRVSDAIGSATVAQRAIRAEPWPGEVDIKVRMGMHTGEADERDHDYFGPVVNRAARMMATAHGDQVVASATTHDLAILEPEPAVTFEDLGWHHLKDLHRPEQIFNVTIDGRAEFAPLRSVSREKVDLPTARTSFVGRSRELSELGRLSSDHRLVTLVGPGGMGKTRLAVEHASTAGEQHRDGVWFVDLSDVNDDGRVATGVSTALGLTVDSTAMAEPAAIGRRIESWQAMVVLDNCEQVLEGAADVVDRILTTCPDVVIVATSREPLAIEGEQLLRLGAMEGGSSSGDGAPRNIGDAARLFLDRARLADPQFDPTANDVKAIEDLVSELDRLPLAIEIAASRIDQLGLDELLAGVLGSTDGGRRRGPDRHRDLQSLVRWSLDLMSETEQIVFRRLAVFDGEFTTDAASTVASLGDVTELQVKAALRRLVDGSMVDSKRTAHGVRHRLLVTVRAVARAELDEASEERATGDAHLRWTSEWSRQASTHQRALRWFPSPIEVTNQRAALRYSISNEDPTASAELMFYVMPALVVGGEVDEAEDVIRSLRGADASGPATRFLDASTMGLAEFRGDFAKSHEFAVRLRTGPEDDQVWFSASAIVGHHLAVAEPRSAAAVYDEMDARLGPTPMAAYGRGEAAVMQGHFDDGVAAMFEAFGIRDLGRLPVSSAQSPLDPVILSDLTVALHLSGRSDEANFVVDALAEAFRDTALVYAYMVPLLRSVVGRDRSARDETMALLHDAEALERQWSPPLGAADCVVGGAMVAAEIGKRRLAARALASVKGGNQRSVGMFALRRTVVRRLRGEMPAEDFAASQAEGADRGPRDAYHDLVEALDAWYTSSIH